MKVQVDFYIFLGRIGKKLGVVGMCKGWQTKLHDDAPFCWMEKMCFHAPSNEENQSLLDEIRIDVIIGNTKCHISQLVPLHHYL